jgi:hypothetical protein
MVNPDEIWITIISYPADVVPLQILLSAVLTTNRTLEKMGLAHRYHAVGEGVYEAKGGDRDE